MAKRKLFDKLNQYNANDVKDPRAQEKYSKLLSNFDDFSKLSPKYMQNLTNGVKDNAAPGWLTSVDYKHKEIDELATQAIAPKKLPKPNEVATAPEKPPKPNKVATAPEKPPKPTKKNIVAAEVEKKPESPNINPASDALGNEKKKTTSFHLPKINLPNPFKRKSAKVLPSQVEAITEEKEKKSEKAVGASKRNNLSMSGIGKIFKDEVIDRVNGEEHRRNIAKYVTPYEETKTKTPPKVSKTKTNKIIAKMTQIANKFSSYASNSVSSNTKKKNKGLEM